MLERESLAGALTRLKKLGDGTFDKVFWAADKLVDSGYMTVSNPHPNLPISVWALFMEAILWHILVMSCDIFQSLSPRTGHLSHDPVILQVWVWTLSINCYCSNSQIYNAVDDTIPAPSLQIYNDDRDTIGSVLRENQNKKVSLGPFQDCFREIRMISLHHWCKSSIGIFLWKILRGFGTHLDSTHKWGYYE